MRPGFAFARAMRSFRWRTGSDGCTDSTLAPLKHRTTGSKSHKVSYGGLARKLSDRVRGAAHQQRGAVGRRADHVFGGDVFVAPGRFSTIVCCFRIGDTLSISARVTKSVLPPGANGLTMRTILPG